MTTPISLLSVLIAVPSLAWGSPDDSNSTGAARMHFTDITAESGINMTLTSGATPSSQVLEVKGGGLALIDFDNDGDLDVFVPNGATLDNPEHGPGARLYENLGGMRFRDVTQASGINHHRWSFGCAVGDVDGDGLDDMFVCCFGPNVLLRNLGGGRFEDATTKAGLDDERKWSASAAFGDLDNDGDLDLFVVNYLDFDPRNPPGRTLFKGVEVMSGPFGLAPAADAVYENLGNGHFRNRSEDSGILSVKPGYGLNAAILDFDRDGWADIFVGNDSQPNNLFHNGGGWALTDIGQKSGIATNMEGAAQATMGVAIGDVDGNGFPDVFTTNFSSDTDTLHLNKNGKFFNDRTAPYGLGPVSRTYLGWACSFQDFDVDGDEDLLVFHGHVYPEATPTTMDTDYRQKPLLMARDGAKFNNVDAAAGGEWLNQTHVDRSAVYADFDGDGDIDVLVGELNGPVRVLRNDADPPRNRWIEIRLRDQAPGGNTHALGSFIEITSNGTTLRRWVYGGGPFQSNSSPVTHFGLASPADTVDVVVHWLGGGTQSAVSLPTGGIREIIREPNDSGK